VTDALDVERFPDARDDVVRRRTTRFVDEQEA